MIKRGALVTSYGAFVVPLMILEAHFTSELFAFDYLTGCESAGRSLLLVIISQSFCMDSDMIFLAFIRCVVLPLNVSLQHGSL